MEVSSKNIQSLVASLNNLNYEVYTRPYELNIVGIRTNNTTPNSFDDKLIVFYKDDKGINQGKVQEGLERHRRGRASNVRQLRAHGVP